MNMTISSRLCWLIVPALWVGHNSVVAQDDDIDQGPAPYNFQSGPVGPTMTGSAQAGTSFMGTSSLAGSFFGLGENVAPGAAVAAWGPFSIYPQLGYLFTYGNGLQAQPGVNSTTVVNTVTPDVMIKIGSHWSLDYTPSETFYSNPLFQNTINQHVTFMGAEAYGDWTLSLSQSYVDTSQPLVETGTQVDQIA